jgi:hypothetical protein
MALVVADRVQETTSTTGTSDYVLLGAAAGYQSFGAVLANGDTTYYAITNDTDWEVGIGTYSTTGPTLARTTILASSNGGSAVSWGVGVKNIFISYAASKASFLDANGALLVADKVVHTGDTDTAIRFPAANTMSVETGGTERFKVENSTITTTVPVLLPADPTLPLQAATKEYVDTIASAGIHYHDPVRVESPINLNATYNNGTSGVGATLTNAGTQVALVIDGVTVATNDRVLVYQQTDQTQNGVYVVTNTGSGSTNWVLTRSTDTDSYGPSDPDALGAGDAFFVQQGSTGAGELYVCNTEGTITFGTTNITFTQIAATAVYSAGSGLALTGTVFSNTAPDQTVTLTQGGATTITGTYPNFTITSTDTTYTAGNGIGLTGTTFSVAAGSGLTQDADGLSHADTSSQASVDNSGATFVQDINLDTFGHVTGLASVTVTPSLIGAPSTTGVGASGSWGISVTGTAANVTGTVAVGNGGTGATTDSQARTNLGLAIGSNVQAYDAGLQSISGLTTSANQMIYTTASDTYATTSLTAAGRAILDDADAAAQRTTLGLGTMATQAASSVSITGGSISGITDLAIADGGTGASDAGTARTNLNVPTRTGGDASGTWGINVTGSSGSTTGNAATVTNGVYTNSNAAISGDNHITFGPNSSWGSSLRVGGNGRTATGTEMASVVTTDGNLHIDAAASSNAIYLNYYAGINGVAFGNGASGTVAWMGPDGDLWKGSSDNTGTQYVQNSGTWGINVTGTSGSISGFNNPTTAATANTIAYRTGDGDIAAREIILSSGLSSSQPTVLVSMFPSTNQLVRTAPSAVANAIRDAASGTWGINVTGSSGSTTGNAATATNLSTNNTNWSTNGTISAVVGQLAWKNYGNSHTIFDASQGTAPNGSAVNNTNAQNVWVGSYPTLMGWNGANTFGVRVDSARVADNTTGNAATVTTVTTAQVGSATAGLAAGAVGSYAFCLLALDTDTDYAAGNTFAGSSLRYAGTSATTSGSSTVMAQSGTPSGTWRNMGYLQNVSSSGGAGSQRQGYTVWLRIS